jgi:hypothetical protein
MKQISLIYLLLFFTPFFTFTQEIKNIDLDEVEQVADALPKIVIDSLAYSMRNRDQDIIKLLKTPFWQEGFKFQIDLEDFKTLKQYTYESNGKVRVFINNIELTQKHKFKNTKAIMSVLENTEYIKISSLHETKKIPKQIPSNEFADQTLFSFETQKVPVTKINVVAPLVSEISYNRKSKKSLPKNITSQRVKTIKLNEVEVVENKIEKGVIYSPTLINGEIVFKKNKALTRLKRKSERYIKSGFNEWGIDVNARTWSMALRAHMRGKKINPSVALWVIDGSPTDAFEGSEVTLFSHSIRKVKIIPPYSPEATLYGGRGSSGIIVLNTTLSGMDHSLNYKRSFVVKGKKNRELMIEYKSYEKRFKDKIDTLKSQLLSSLASNQIAKTDSIINEINKTESMSKLFTANFALKHSEHEIAPYLALTELSDMNSSILDSIESKLSPKVKSSKYGKKFTNALNSKNQ